MVGNIKPKHLLKNYLQEKGVSMMSVFKEHLKKIKTWFSYFANKNHSKLKRRPFSKKFSLFSLLSLTFAHRHLPAIVDLQLRQIVDVTKLDAWTLPAFPNSWRTLKVAPPLFLIFKHVARQHLHHYRENFILQQFSSLLVPASKRNHLF